jgi:hypothetical protein
MTEPDVLPHSEVGLPNPALRDRVLAAARAEPASTRAIGARRRARLVALAFAFTVVLSVAIGRPGLRARPFAYVAWLAVAWLVVGAVATWAGVSRGGSMLGRGRLWRTAVAALTPLALLGSALVCGAVWPETLVDRSAIDNHLLCFAGTTAFAMGPLVAFFRIRAASDPVSPGLMGAALGAAAGVWGALAIELHCRFASPFHVAVGHVLPVAVLVLAGIAGGGRLLAVRARGQ